MKCFKCKTEIKAGAKFCPHCGEAQGFPEELIIKAKSGNQDAIAELYNCTYNNVYYTVKSMIKDEDTVLDIVQDSYVKGFQNLEQLREADKFRAWIRQIAHNRSIDHLRKYKPTVFMNISTDSKETIEFEDDRPENLPDVVVDQKETSRLMKEILDSLSEEQRLVVGMYYYEQLTTKEIAKTLGVSENTVKSRLSYGRKKIEIQVKDLEKRGTKLYGLAPLPFLMLLFKSADAQAAKPEPAVLKIIQQGITGMPNLSHGQAAAKITSVNAAKSVSAKVIAGVVVTAIVGGGSIGGVLYQNHKHQEKPTTLETTVKSEKEKPNTKKPETDPENVYASILEEYRMAMVQGSLGEELPNVNPNVMFWYTKGVTDICYAYYDIDKNGINELLIGYGTNSIDVADIYTIKNNMPKRVIEEQGEYVSSSIYPDGKIKTEYYDAGELVDVLVQDFTEDGTDITVLHEYNSLSEEDFETYVSEALDYQEPIKDFNWKAFDTSG